MDHFEMVDAANETAVVDEVRIPRALADRVMTALDAFIKDEFHSWSMADVETADAFRAALSAQPGGAE